VAATAAVVVEGAPPPPDDDDDLAAGPPLGRAEVAQGLAVRAAILARRACCSAVRGAYSSYDDDDDDCCCRFLDEDGGSAPPLADVECLDVDGVAKPKDEDDAAGVDRPDESLEQTMTASAAAASAAAAADSGQQTADGCGMTINLLIGKLRGRVRQWMGCQRWMGV
jgi:hypothetical protein